MPKPVKDKLAQHLQNEQVKIDACMKDARVKIDKAIEQAGPYSHNIISLVLRSVADKFGYRYANDLVREYDLTELYGIDEIEEKGN